MTRDLRTFLIATGLCLILVLPAMAGKDNDNVGTTVFNFLKIDAGARPMALGGAFTGLADDENSLYYNPAGIVALDGKRFIAGYHNYIFDMQSGFLGYIHPLGADKSLALQVNYLNYGDFIRTDEDGNEDGTFGGSDLLLAGTFAMELRPNVYVGLSGKFFYEKIDTYSSSGLAADLGAKFVLKRDRYSDSAMTVIGLMIQNLGGQISSFADGGETYSIPTVIRAGFSAILRELPFLVTADVVKPLDNDFYLAGGVEFLKLYPLYLRIGYTTFGTNYKTDGGDGALAGFTAGFGVSYKKMQISYTISPQADLGTSHRITFTGGI